jgi:hypothetical protein
MNKHLDCGQKHDASWTPNCMTCRALFDRDLWRELATDLYSLVSHESNCEAWVRTRTHVDCECGVGEVLIRFEEAAIE